jgi:hypothetical protein
MKVTRVRTISFRNLWDGMLLAVVALSLQACGGGGGTGGGDTTPPPGGGGGSATASGTIWHNSLTTDSVKRSKLSVFSGAATRAIDAKPTAVPSRDGRQFITWEYDTRPDKRTTVLELKQTSTGATLQTLTLKGYVREPRLSPLNNGIVLVRWSSNANATDDEQVIVDLAKGQVVETLGGNDVAANWIPDGRYILLLANGDLFVANPGASRTANGRVFVLGRLPVGLWVSPQGDQMVTRWRVVQGDVVLSDLWMSSLSGGSFERFTTSEISRDAVWSPDGKYVGYSNKPDLVCTAFTCPFTDCDPKYAPASSRGLTKVDGRALDFRLLDTESRAITLGCEINGWTS